MLVVEEENTQMKMRILKDMGESKTIRLDH